MKEALRSFYRLKRKRVAEKRLKDLIEIAFLSDDAAMVQWGRTLKKWSPYILNYFDKRTTNAYTEGIHTKMKMVKRISFGFRNVEVYVRKVLLSLFPLAVILSLHHFSHILLLTFPLIEWGDPRYALCLAPIQPTPPSATLTRE